VRGHRLVRRLQGERAAWHEPQQVALAAAVRTVAFGELADLAFHGEADVAAMAAALVGHVNPPLRFVVMVAKKPRARHGMNTLPRAFRHAAKDLPILPAMLIVPNYRRASVRCSNAAFPARLSCRYSSNNDSSNPKGRLSHAR